MESLGNSVVICDRWAVSPSASKSHMVRLIIVHDMVEVKVVSLFP